MNNPKITAPTMESLPKTLAAIRDALKQKDATIVQRMNAIR
jgi:hypothetical protein